MCGLNYDRNFSPQNIQKKWFEEQIILAEELNMPLFLHDATNANQILSYCTVCQTS